MQSKTSGGRRRRGVNASTGRNQDDMLAMRKRDHGSVPAHAGATGFLPGVLPAAASYCCDCLRLSHYSDTAPTLLLATPGVRRSGRPTCQSRQLAPTLCVRRSRRMVKSWNVAALHTVWHYRRRRFSLSRFFDLCFQESLPLVDKPNSWLLPAS